MSGVSSDHGTVPAAPTQARAEPAIMWQFTRFRVIPAREHEVLAARRASLRECWDASPPLLEAYLLRLDEEEWLDVTIWAGHVCGEAATPAQSPARYAFFEQLDELLGEETAIAVAHESPVTPGWLEGGDSRDLPHPCPGQAGQAAP
jgi:hypothetical protein